MADLAQWMEENGYDDDDLVADLSKRAKIKLDRSQVSRIRRGKSRPSEKTARGLEKITAIPWHEFFPPPVKTSRRGAEAGP
jgi:transcriptional regulator with XRE-family HTH domain